MKIRITRSPARNARIAAVAFALLGAAAAQQALADVTFYEGEGFRGAAFEANRPVADRAHGIQRPCLLGNRH